MKMLDSAMEITGVKLISKKGGKSSFLNSLEAPLKGAVLVASDTASKDPDSDVSGKIIVDRMKQEGIEVADYTILPDEKDLIAERLEYYGDELKVDLVLTTGGTGFGPRDVMPEAMAKIIERDASGISEAIRNFGQARTPYAMLSRGRSGIRGKTVIINLPGSKTGVSESLYALFPGVIHAFPMICGHGHEQSLED